jgi:hypothetical protein
MTSKRARVGESLATSFTGMRPFSGTDDQLLQVRRADIQAYCVRMCTVKADLCMKDLPQLGSIQTKGLIYQCRPFF